MNHEGELQALLSVPSLSSPLVSPDGEWVAWSWSRIGPAADVFAVRTDGLNGPIRLTETLDSTYPVSWTPDSAGLIVEQDHDGDERTQLFLARPDEPGRMKPLTGPSPNYYIRGGQLHKNGRWLVYAANHDFEARKEIEPAHIIRHDLETGERKVLARPERGNFQAPELSRPGDFVLYHRNDLDPSGLQVWLVDIEGEDDCEILNFGPKAKVHASWFPDGKRVLFVTEHGRRRRLGVWEDGEITTLIDDPKRNVEYAFVPPNGGPVVAIEIERARERATLIDPESGEEQRLPENFVPLARTSDAWLGLRYGSQYPADLVRLKSSGEAASVTGFRDRASLDLGKLAPAEDFTWKSVDGLKIQGWLYKARESIGAIVVVHGGPTAHSEDYFSAQIQYFVSRGFNVLCPNYRGSTGFGLEFQEEIKTDGWGGREQDDIIRGVEALVEAGIAKPGKVGITGASYGGYSAWCAITHYPPELVAASAPICGMTDLVVDYETTRPDLRPYSEEMMGGSPNEAPKRYHERSPINFVKNIRGRLLIVQGANDPNVTPENVEAMKRELERHSIPYNLLTFENEGHGVVRPENLKVLYPRLADFFEEAFQGRFASAAPRRSGGIVRWRSRENKYHSSTKFDELTVIVQQLCKIGKVAGFNWRRRLRWM
ncbi:MAG: alpha/beta fold hydrolase [Rubrobacteraceae bacterium]